jgi:acetylornithine deacetylase/succinyl-diaminopimelate desuccinylase family protein
LLQQLIRIPSPNPPGDCRAIADFCDEFLQKAGFETLKVAPDDRAWSVVGWTGNGNGSTILYHAHLDTVPLGQNAKWRFDPFGGDLVDRRVYGLGSVDGKASLAAMLQAAADCRARLSQICGRLVIACVAEEKVGGVLGTKWLADNGHLPESDYVIVGEQTHNRVATANKGVIRAVFHVGGRTAHATEPRRGRNAINGMAHLILALEAYQSELEQRSHPLMGPPSINAGVIQGGVSANMVPDACTLYVDRRMVPGEDPDNVIRELQAIVQAQQAVDQERTYRVDGFQISNWFQSDGDDTLTRHLMALASEITGAPREPVGYAPGSDAKHLVGVARKGMAVFGPGTYEVAHSTDEYTVVAELESTYHILSRFIEETLSEDSAVSRPETSSDPE